MNGEKAEPVALGGASEADRWGLREPTGGPPGKPAVRTPSETRRLVRLLEDEPSVAGRFRAVELSEVEPGRSGAWMVHGTWDASGASFPVIVKLGAGAREVHWATQLSRSAPDVADVADVVDVVPTVYAAGYALGGEPVPWLVMERCPYVLDRRWLREPWAHHLVTTLLDAGVRFHVAARRIAPPVGPADVWRNWVNERVRRGATSDPPAPGPTQQVVERLESDWEWVLSVCGVEFAHGDLHLGNAVWRTALFEPDATALLVDHAPYPMPWALEAARCEAIYWGEWTRQTRRTRRPIHPTTVHEMAALRAAQGMEVPAPADVDRLAAMCVAWEALGLWSNPMRTGYQTMAKYVATFTRWMEDAAHA